VSRVRELDCEGALASLRAVLLHRPDAHPIWHTYLVSLVHLRPIAGYPPVHLAFPDASHEITIVALDPDDPQPDPARPSTIRALTPPNLVHQLRARSDAMARGVFAAFVQALLTGSLNPDTDHRQCQIDWLNRWERAS